MLGSLGTHHGQENRCATGTLCPGVFPTGKVSGFPDEKSVTSWHQTEAGLCQEKQTMAGDGPQAFAYREEKVIMAVHNGAISSRLYYYLVIVSQLQSPLAKLPGVE